MKSISIDDLIQMLQDEKEQGAKTASIQGTLLTDNGNTVILTTEKQM